MKNTILYIPLDERPCNVSYPAAFFAEVREPLLTPPFEFLGLKKTPADVPAIFNWVEESAANASTIVASADMLLYGGLLPSRIHELNSETLNHRLNRLLSIKTHNPKLKLYVFVLIMRSPSYNSSGEEPDYYEIWGRDLHYIGRYRHRKAINAITAPEEAELTAIERRIPSDILHDYLRRRECNVSYTKALIQATHDGKIDYLVIPQDDSAEFSFSSLERNTVLKTTASSDSRIINYPGADELGCSLSARAWAADRTTELLPLFSHEEGLGVIPRYEDRELRETIQQHFSLTGIREAGSPNQAVIAFNLPVSATCEAAEQNLEHSAQAPASSVRLLEAIAALPSGTPVYLADIRFTNGGDATLLRLLDRAGLLGKLAFYAAWNTCGNTIGTVCAAAVLGITSREILKKRIFEDFGYMAVVRQELADMDFPPISREGSTTQGTLQTLGERVQKRINETLRQTCPNSPWLHDTEYEVYFPWNRAFEIGLKS